MMLRYALRIALVAVLAGSFFCSAAMAQGTSIKIDRTHKVGETVKEVGTFEEVYKLEVMDGGKVVQSDASGISASYDIDIKITATKDDKKVTGAELTIHKWDMTLSGKPNDHIKQGMKIELKEVDGQIFFTSKNVELDATDISLLTMFIPPIREEKEDLTYGVKEAKEAGATWAYDKAKAAERLAQSGLSVTPENIIGEVKFEKVLPLKGLECARLVVAEKVDKVGGFKLNGTDLTKIGKAVYESKTIYDCPTDTKLNAGGSSFDLKIIVEGEINTDNGVVNVKFDRELKCTGFRTIVK